MREWEFKTSKIFIAGLLNMRAAMLNNGFFVHSINLLPTLLGELVIACSSLKDLEGIAPPVYFLGSGTCCWLAGKFTFITWIGVSKSKNDEKSTWLDVFSIQVNKALVISNRVQSMIDEYNSIKEHQRANRQPKTTLQTIVQTIIYRRISNFYFASW